MPKKQKFRKEQKRSLAGKATRKIHISFGSFGLKALQASLVSARQIEAARRVMTKYTKKGGRIWIRIFPDKSMTIKGGEIPMGKGKGSPDHFVAIVKPGMVMFEMDGIPLDQAKEAMELAAYKLPIKCKFIVK